MRTLGPFRGRGEVAKGWYKSVTGTRGGNHGQQRAKRTNKGQPGANQGQ
jgi:hypothetical protein